MNDPIATTLDDATMATISAPLRAANLEFTRILPGESTQRQPVHTVYGGAHLFRADITAKLGAAALRAMDEYLGDANAFTATFGTVGAGPELRDRVRARLSHEPVEDYRIDFEDGYGERSDDEEDGHAIAAARDVAEGMRRGTLPRGIGIRVKSLAESTRTRSLRTLDVFLTALRSNAGAQLPDGFVVTLPKPMLAAQVHALVDALDVLETRLGLARGAVRVELMVELPQALIDPQGMIALPGLVRAARGRCTSAHFGTYDYTAALGVAATAQGMRHPACDFARQLMQVSLAGTGVRVSDGATNVLPIAPHRARDGVPLTDAERGENSRVVREAWALHATNIADSLSRGIYQGWDLHPAQLVARYATVYAFFAHAAARSAGRLRNFVERAGQATRVGAVFDDAATGQGLLNVFVRALDCGALTDAEVSAMTGVAPDAMRTRSFPAIVAATPRDAQLPR